LTDLQETLATYCSTFVRIHAAAFCCKYSAVDVRLASAKSRAYIYHETPKLIEVALHNFILCALQLFALFRLHFGRILLQRQKQTSEYFQTRSMPGLTVCSADPASVRYTCRV